MSAGRVPTDPTTCSWDNRSGGERLSAEDDTHLCMMLSTLGHDVFYLCLSSSARIDFSLWREKKFFKENAYLWTSSRGQVLSSTVAEKETDCSTQTTILWRLMPEKVNLLVSKLVLALQNELEQLRDSSWWIQGHVSEEKSLKKFFVVCDSFCGQNVDLDREGAGGPTIARSLFSARTRSFAMLVSARSLVWREKESKLEKATEEICASGRPLFVFSRHCKTVVC